MYLMLGTLAVIGFVAFFERWPQPFLSLFILAIPFYMATLTLVIFIHPILCANILVKKIKNKNNVKPVAIHLVWSSAITTIFVGMVMNGYIITA